LIISKIATKLRRTERQLIRAESASLMSLKLRVNLPKASTLRVPSRKNYASEKIAEEM